MNKTLLIGISGMLLATTAAFARQTVPTAPHSVQPPTVENPSHQLTRIAGKVTFTGGNPAANAQVYLSWTTNNGKEPRWQQMAADNKGVFQASIDFPSNPYGDRLW